MSIEEWKLTDPDNFQYGKKVSEGIYQFKEFDRLSFRDIFYELQHMDIEKSKLYIELNFDCPDFWIEETVHITTATDVEKELFIDGYYDSLSALKEICGGDMEQVNWIVAECCFEQGSILY